MASEMASCARMECLWTIRGCGCGDDVLIVKPHHRPVFAVMYSQSASWWIVRIILANNLSPLSSARPRLVASEPRNVAIFTADFPTHEGDHSASIISVSRWQRWTYPWILTYLLHCKYSYVWRNILNIHRRASLNFDRYFRWINAKW